MCNSTRDFDYLMILKFVADILHSTSLDRLLMVSGSAADVKHPAAVQALRQAAHIALPSTPYAVRESIMWDCKPGSGSGELPKIEGGAFTPLGPGQALHLTSTSSTREDASHDASTPPIRCHPGSPREVLFMKNLFSSSSCLQALTREHICRARVSCFFFCLFRFMCTGVDIS